VNQFPYISYTLFLKIKQIVNNPLALESNSCIIRGSKFVSCVTSLFKRFGHTRIENWSAYKDNTTRNKSYMSNKLYVGGLAWATTNESLGNAFAAAGAVTSAEVIVDRMSGRSKGFGFVEMADAAAAAAAIAMWNGKELDGRVITVNEARPMEDRPPRPAGGAYASRPPRRDGAAGGYGAPRTGGYGAGSTGGNRW
jgi:hypothetical protein